MDSTDMTDDNCKSLNCVSNVKFSRLTMRQLAAQQCVWGFIVLVFITSSNLFIITLILMFF